MSKNELDQKVPEKVAAKAEALGSINCPTYVYKDEDYQKVYDQAKRETETGE